MDNITENDFNEALNQISNLGGEIKKHSSVIREYYEQQRQRKHREATYTINRSAIQFREGFSVLVERAIASKYGTLDDYVRLKKVSPDLLKKFLAFHTSGGQLLNFIFQADMSVQISTTNGKSAFFPQPRSAFSEVQANERVFRQEFEKILSEIINKRSGGKISFQKEVNLDSTALNQTLYFNFSHEAHLFQVLHFTGTLLEISYKFEKVKFQG